jgi:hypothetical protein
MIGVGWVRGLMNCPDQSSDKVRSKEQTMASLQDLEFAYAPVRDQVRDLREYL